MNLAYNQFVKGDRFVRKTYLTDKELDKIFDILSGNMQKIGFKVNEQDKLNWIQGFKTSLQGENEFCYLIYHDGNLCGYIEINIINNELHIPELELSKEYQQTRLILSVINLL